MILKKKRKPVFCKGCANLLLIPGFAPQCLASATFISGPLRAKVDIKGRVSAEKRNLWNDCKYRRRLSLLAYRLKKWILWRVNDEGRKRPKLREEHLKDYSVEIEGTKKKGYLEERRERRSVKNDTSILIEDLKKIDGELDAIEEADSEDLLDGGGIDD